MIAEYARLHPTIIKEVIMSYSDLNVEPTTDNISVFFPWFINELETKVNLVSAIVITFEFMESVVGLVKMTKDERDSLFKDKTKEKGKIYEFIFEHTNYNKPGIETMEQLLLTCYLFYADIYVAFKYSFEMLATGDEYEKNKLTTFAQCMPITSSFSISISKLHVLKVNSNQYIQLSLQFHYYCSKLLIVLIEILNL